VEGVPGAEDTVKESLNNIAGAFARGVSGLTYGISGCLEYGNTGKTVITPPNVSGPQENPPKLFWGQRKKEITFRRSSFTSAKHDEQFHKDLVDLPSARGNDKNIFSADALLDLHRCLAVTEFAEKNLAFWDAETGAY